MTQLRPSKFLAKGKDSHIPPTGQLTPRLGYKVGRVDQSETALGAEMRVAKSKGKPVEDKGKEKIVRRYIETRRQLRIGADLSTESSTKFIPTERSSTRNSLRMNKLVIVSPFARTSMLSKAVASAFVY